MKSNIFTTVRFIMALLTVLAIAGKPYIPPKTLLIHPSPATISSLYGPTDVASGKVATWVDQAASDWRCNYKAIYGHLSCGLALSWNLISSDSCSAGTGYPRCLSADSDEDGDGWGWEDEQSCIVVDAPTSNREDSNGRTSTAWPVSPFCNSADSDPDGDSWGWENGQSCFVATVGHNRTVADSRNEADVPICSSADTDPDGDGWGWENERSCRVATVEPDNTTLAVHKEPQVLVCSSADTDPDGDGWGWENEQSCRVDGSAVGIPREAAERPGCSDDGVENDDGCRAAGVPDSNPASAATREDLCVGGNPAVDAEDAAQAFRSIDFSQYDGFNVKIHYEGRAKFLRLYLRNLNPQTSQYKDFTSGKFMSAFLRTEDLKAGAAYVDLTEFSVEEWWVLMHNPPRELARPEFGHIVTAGVDHVEHGMHRMRVDRIELVGERVSMTNFLTAILLFWAGFLLLEGAIRYYYLYTSTRLREVQIGELAGHAQQLEKEKDVLTTRSVTDALTGTLNRAGVVHQLKMRFASEDLPPDYSMMVIDIDHFKKINDTHGHDAGDRILQMLAQLVTSHTRDDDIFARWGGEEFIFITPHKGKQNLLTIADKLRTLVANHRFEPALKVNVTISMGVTVVRDNERFSSTFKRADVALYKAKKTRNCIVYEE